MTNDLKITCPKCKETFDAADAFNAHYKNTQIENDKRIKEVQKIAAEEAEKKFKSQIENQKLESEKFKQEAQKKATEEAEKKFKSQIEIKNKNLKNLNKKPFSLQTKKQLKNINCNQKTRISKSKK